MLWTMHLLCNLMLVMEQKPRRQPTTGVNRSSNEALRILASLIAQFHIKRLTGDEMLKDDAHDSGERNNESLP